MNEIIENYQKSMEREVSINNQVQKEFESWLKDKYPNECYDIYCKYLSIRLNVITKEIEKK